MAKKVRNEDYLYASGRIHAMSVRSFSPSHIERMIDAKTEEEAIKVLSEVGITPDGNEDMLTKARAERFAELASFLPDKRLMQLFRLRYDYHNLKAAMKTTKMWIRMFSPDGEMSKDDIEAVCWHKEYDKLAPEMKEGVVEAREIFNRTGDPQLLDFRLDRAMFAQMRRLADEMGSDYTAGYVRRMIDTANLKIYVRTVRLGKGRAILEKSLIPGGADTSELLDDASGENLERVFSDLKPVLDAAKNAIAKTDSVIQVERKCDALIRDYVNEGARQAFGEAVALSYLYNFEDTLSKIRIILAGRRAGLTPDAIRERL